MKWGEYSSDVQFILQRSEQTLPQSQQQIERQQEKQQLGLEKGYHVRQSSFPTTNNNAISCSRSNPTSPIKQLYKKGENMSMPQFNQNPDYNKKQILLAPAETLAPTMIEQSIQSSTQQFHDQINRSFTSADVRNSLDRKINNLVPQQYNQSFSYELRLGANNKQNNNSTISSNGSLAPPPYRPPPSPSLNQNSLDSSAKSLDEITDAQDLHNVQYKELVQLIQFQREKLSMQQADLNKYDAEIVYLESKSHEQFQQLEAISQEINKTDLIFRQGFEQLKILLFVEEQHQIVRKQEKTLKNEIASLQSKIAASEQDLVHCKNKIRLLMEEVYLEQRNMTQLNGRQQIERHLMTEVDRIQSEIDLAIQSSEQSSKAAENLKKDIAMIENAILEKKKQLESLIHEMKEVNLHSLTVAPTEEVKTVVESKYTTFNLFNSSLKFKVSKNVVRGCLQIT